MRMTCDSCGDPVSALGSHVKDGGVYWHISCWLDPKLAEMREEGRQALLEEQTLAREAERARAEALEAAAARHRIDQQRREAEAQLAGARKCVRCLVPIVLPRTDHPNTCDRCWNSDVPTKAVAAAAAPLEKLEKELDKLGGKDAKKEKPDRFDLLDLD